MLRRAIEKTADSLSFAALAFQYKSERQRALQVFRQEHPDDPSLQNKDLSSPSGLDAPSPFEYLSFLTALSHIAHQIGPKIAEYHLISEDKSGRVPTLVLAFWQQRVEDARVANDPEYKAWLQHLSDSGHRPRVNFLLSGKSARDNQPQIRSFLEYNQAAFREQPNLLVTDNIDEGESLERVLKVCDTLQIPVDVAVLSHYEPLAKYDWLLKGRMVYHGESLPSNAQIFSVPAGGTVIGRHSLTGLKTDHDHPKHFPSVKEDRYRQRPLELLVRRQARDFANHLSLPS